MYIQNNVSITIRKNSMFLLSFFILGFTLIVLFVLISVNSQLYDIEMISLSIFFFFILTFILINEKDKFTPIVFFSLLFYGYVFSGLYFSYYENINTAKFFNFHGNFTTEDLKMSLYKVILGYMFFIIGYKLTNSFKITSINFNVNNINYNSRCLKFFLINLFIFSFSYWLYVSFRIAEGPIHLLLNMAQYLLFLENHYISTAPYLFAYMTNSLLFLIYLNNNQKIPFYLVFMILLSFIMYVSTGRLSGSVFYLLSFVLMYFIHYKIRIRFKFYIYFFIFIIFFISLYFYREYSNMRYLGLEMESNIFELIGKHFFGMTNFGDLQSITFANDYTKNNNYLYGVSLLDSLMMWIGKIPGITIESTSIGLRLREYYFSDVPTGAPAPGIISEMIMNFGYLGNTVFMLILGIFFSVINKFFGNKNNILAIFVYSHFLLFVLMLAKVDSTHIDSFIFSTIPLFALLFLIVIFKKIILLKERIND
jgi:oligosaccharide repeat unit polymerase